MTHCAADCIGPRVAIAALQWKVARARKPDLILLDIVALTASAMRGAHDKGLLMGFTAYITKPVSLSQLREEMVRPLSDVES